MAKADSTLTGVINPTELYTLRTFKQRLGIKDASLRAARRAGLRVTYLHRQGFVYGKDWIDYVLKSNPTAASDSTTEQR